MREPRACSLRDGRRHGSVVTRRRERPGYLFGSDAASGIQRATFCQGDEGGVESVSSPAVAVASQASAAAVAQSGALEGAVLDATGFVLPGVTVEARN